jgi:hypothetical protein
MRVADLIASHDDTHRLALEDDDAVRPGAGLV